MVASEWRSMWRLESLGLAICGVAVMFFLPCLGWAHHQKFPKKKPRFFRLYRMLEVLGEERARATRSKNGITVRYRSFLLYLVIWHLHGRGGLAKFSRSKWSFLRTPRIEAPRVS